MPLRRQLAKSPGGPPLSEKRNLYIELMAKGLSNSAACRVVGVNRKTGTRWRRGRTIVNRAGEPRTYPSIIDQPGARSDRFLSEAERVLIAEGLLAGGTIRAIATGIGRSPSTVSREVRRNRDPVSGRYLPFGAHRRAGQRRHRPKTAKLAAHAELRDYVQQRLDRRWSPEQISKTLPIVFDDQPDMRVCHETIYQALYAPRLGPLHRSAARVLRSGRGRRRPQRRLDRRMTRFVEPMTMVSQRPAEVAERTVAGHWEGDLIMGRKNRSAIGTLVERTTRYLTLLHLPDGHTAEQVSAALLSAFGSLPDHLRRSLTWDQGSEMSCHGDITLATGMAVYFCDPASPWQRGSNENTNGLLRQYFPKGSDLAVHSPEVLAAVASELNQRPRKTLAWHTPHDHLERLRSPTQTPPRCDDP
jgi:IS30 family transposase